jgi:hypothetical protein
VSAPETITVSNAANASAPLSVLNVSLSGSNPGDFLVGMGCTSAVAPGGSCILPIYFAPQAQGARSAILSITTDDPAHPTLTANLSGVGGALPQGPEGIQGPQGPQGPQGSAGSVVLVKCHTVTKRVRHKTKKVQKCSTKTLRAGTRFTIHGRDVIASLSHAGVIYARGTSDDGRLVFGAVRFLRPGRYTLTLASRHGRRWIVTRKEILIG